MTNLPDVRDALVRAAVKNGVVADAVPESLTTARSRTAHGGRRRRGALFGGLIIVLGSATAAAAGLFDNPYTPGLPKVAADSGFSIQLQREWPALRGPTGPAPKAIRDLLPTAERGFNTAQARRISTPGGVGYVFPAMHGDVCMATSTPAPQGSDAAPEWGLGCNHPGDAGAMRLGTADDEGNRQVTALVPEGARAVIRAGSDEETVDAENGVVNVTLTNGQELDIRPAQDGAE